MKYSTFISLFLCGSLLAPAIARPCTVVAVGKKATPDGSIIIAHTDAGPDSRLFVVPARTYEPGAKAAVHFGIQDAERPLHDDGDVLGHIPQARQTYAYVHSAYSHINEHQLAIAESTTNQRDGLKVTRKTGKQIMTIEQAMIFALQRHKKAREAVQFIGSLMTTYGFLPSSGDGSEALVIADPDEAWIFEVFGVGKGWTRASKKPGAIWAAQRLGDDQAAMIPNWSIIKEIDASDTKNFLVSANYKSEAIDRGFYDPASGKPFIWQDAYAPVPMEFATGRFWLFHQTFAKKQGKWPNRTLEGDAHLGLQPFFQTVEPLSIYPFSIKPDRKISLRQVIAFTRSTFEGTLYDMTAEPQWLVTDKKGKLQRSPLATPFPGSDLRRLLKLTYRRPVARHRGHYGMVCQLRGWLPDEIGGVYWVYLDNPYFSPYVPIYAGNTSVAATYAIYNPEKYAVKSARWAIDFVDNLANLKFQEIIREVRSVRDPFERGVFARQKQLEQKALMLHKKDPKAAQKLLTDYSNSLMNQVTDMFIMLRNQIITRHTNNRE